MLSESRFAILLSVCALLASVWQSFEARRANSLNSEDIRIDAKNLPLTAVSCGKQYNSVAIPWTIVLVNNSTQPVLLNKLSIRAILPVGWQSQTTGLSPDLTTTVNHGFPLQIAAKTHQVVATELVIPVATQYAQLAEKIGVCNRTDRDVVEGGPKLVLKFYTENEFYKTPFSHWGWPVAAIQSNQLGVRISAETSSGNSFVGYGFVADPYMSAF